ncbi:MAG TPA: hypothetical protein VK660_05015 [Xanthomonadaceae bacterium]|nr:hypothetical protein [Xanthomonadaceae bacterium]
MSNAIVFANACLAVIFRGGLGVATGFFFATDACVVFTGVAFFATGLGAGFFAAVFLATVLADNVFFAAAFLATGAFAAGFLAAAFFVDDAFAAGFACAGFAVFLAVLALLLAVDDLLVAMTSPSDGCRRDSPSLRAAMLQIQRGATMHSAHERDDQHQRSDSPAAEPTCGSDRIYSTPQRKRAKSTWVRLKDLPGSWEATIRVR